MLHSVFFLSRCTATAIKGSNLNHGKVTYSR